MKKSAPSLLSMMLLGLIALWLAGCATGPTATAPAKTTPEMLREAGFKLYPAETPQELAHLRTCPADTVMIHERPGAKCYAFADPPSKSMYIGDEEAYQRFKAILEKQERRIREQRIESDPLFWPMWGTRWGGG
ncbi:MAG: hypothetical protein FJ128_14300 [Deltaproteobacteria bacterium]|nr:hypothetical protein [Deltaproteobacteria bacterium]